MPSADQLSATQRADEFRKSDARLRATADLMAYLTLEECAIVSGEMHESFMRELGRQEARLQ
jgi:hypothetical protein